MKFRLVWNPVRLSTLTSSVGIHVCTAILAFPSDFFPTQPWCADSAASLSMEGTHDVVLTDKISEPKDFEQLKRGQAKGRSRISRQKVEKKPFPLGAQN